MRLSGETPGSKFTVAENNSGVKPLGSFTTIVVAVAFCCIPWCCRWRQHSKCEVLRVGGRREVNGLIRWRLIRQKTLSTLLPPFRSNPLRVGKQIRGWVYSRVKWDGCILLVCSRNLILSTRCVTSRCNIVCDQRNMTIY